MTHDPLFRRQAVPIHQWTAPLTPRRPRRPRNDGLRYTSTGILDMTRRRRTLWPGAQAEPILMVIRAR